MSFTSISSHFARDKSQRVVRLPPISQIFDMQTRSFDLVQASGLCTLPSRYKKKGLDAYAETRSWLDLDGGDDESIELKDHVSFLQDKLCQKARTSCRTDIDLDDLHRFLFQRRKGCVSYNPRVNSGPVATKKPETKDHAIKERGRRTHQRGTLQITDLTSSDFIREVSSQYIDLVKESQEAQLVEQARAEGRSYVSRTRSSNVSRRNTARGPNKDEVHVRVLFTAILAGLIVKQQMGIARAYKDLKHEYKALQAHTRQVESKMGELHEELYKQSQASLRLDTAMVQHQPDIQQHGSSHNLEHDRTMNAARRVSQIHRHLDNEAHKTEARLHPYGLPSPAPSSIDGSCQSSFNQAS